MALVTRYPHGTLSWMAAQSTDIDADSAFYAAVFGWQADHTADGISFRKDGARVAGMTAAPDGATSRWLAQITVSDLNAAVTQVRAAGGQVLAGPATHANAGQRALIADPTGAPLFLWQAGDQIGAERINEDGAMVWNEINTWDAAATMRFYGELLGWSFRKQADHETGYWLIDNAGRQAGGVLQMTADWEGIQPHWMNYLHVDDTAATLDRVQASGGTVVFGPIDDPGGAITIFAAPSGAQFSTVQSARIDTWVE